MQDRPPPPAGVSPAIWSLHVAVHEHRDQRARTALVCEYRPNAIAIAHRLHRQREPIEDLVQVALEALLLAIDRFDPGRGVPFLGFATPTIVGTVKRHYRDRGWSMRVPRDAHELLPPIAAARSSLQADLGREPLVDEIADLLDVAPHRIVAALRAGAAREIGSFEPADHDARPTEPVSRESGFDRVDNVVALGQAMDRLDEVQRRALSMYFDEGMTQTAIGEAIGRSQMSVSRLISRTIHDLRTVLDAS